MEKWIILTSIDASKAVNNKISFLDSIAACGEDDTLLIFDSLEDAMDFRDDHEINGKCVELPID